MLVWWELQVSGVINHFYPLVNGTQCVRLPLPSSGISMFSSLRVQQLLVEDVLHQLCPPVLLTLLLTEEAPNLLSCRLKRCPGNKAANRNHFRFMSRIVNITLVNTQKNGLKVCGSFFFFFPQEDTSFNSSFLYWLTFFTDSESLLSTDLHLEQNSKESQVFSKKCFYK